MLQPALSFIAGALFGAAFLAFMLRRTVRRELGHLPRRTPLLERLRRRPLPDPRRRNGY